MGKPTINAKSVLKDIKSGMTKADLMEKYKLSPKGLESLYEKLVSAGLMQAGELTKRTVQRQGTEAPSPRPTPKPGVGPRSSQRPARSERVPDASSVKPSAGSAQLKVSEQAKAIADDINAGMHDNEILRRHEISPGQFRQIKERLVQAGLLGRAEPGSAPSRSSKTCPSCGHEISSTAAKCARCGEWLDDQAGAAPVDRGGPAEQSTPRPPPPEAIHSTDDDLDDEEECPWEERENYGTLSAFIQTATKCLLTPTRFFSKLPVTGGFLNPILFAGFSLVVSLALAYAWTQLFMRGAGFLGLIFALVFGMVVAAIAVPIGLFIWSGILHVCLLMVGGAHRGFEATFRVVSYASVTNLFHAIPFVGNLISLWGMVLTVIGLRETHRTSTGKAVAAVAIPLVAAVGLAVILLIMGFFAAKTAFRGPAITTELSGQALPTEVCAAIQEYLAEVDFANDMEDAKTAQEHLQQAMESLNETLKAHSSHPDIDEVRQLATVYGMAGVAQKQLKSAMPGMMPDLGGAAEEHREMLSSMCP
ncbi:MAG: YIP1 family protein [Desulfomonilaceae bacterium]|nr:YIP1 family protein [Desulfomonilaceae bacterium]